MEAMNNTQSFEDAISSENGSFVIANEVATSSPQSRWMGSELSLPMGYP